MAAGDVDVAITQPSSIPCASFDGVDDVIYANVINQSGDISTISFWVKLKSTAAAQQMYINSPASNRRFGIDFETNIIEAGYYNGTSNVGNRGSSTISINVWYHVTYTFNGVTTGNLYINGILDNASTPAQNTLSSGLRFGDRGLGVDNLNGFMRNVRVYNRVLSQAEITRLANDEDIRDGLVGHWPLNGNAEDTVGNNDGTVTGAVFINDCANLDTAMTTQRTTVGGISGSYLLCDVQGGSQVISTAIDEA